MAETSTNLGRVSIVPKGDYSESEAYKRLDMVKHAGSSYIAKRDVTGVTPTDGADWMLVASVGGAGKDGVSPTVKTSKVGKTTTVTITDANGEHSFEIQDGADGGGSGDMLASVYDTHNKRKDIFDYVDNAIASGGGGGGSGGEDKVSKSGDTMTGPLVVQSQTAINCETKIEGSKMVFGTDDLPASSEKLKIDWSTGTEIACEGEWDFKIATFEHATTQRVPESNYDIANKKYVDDTVAAAGGGGGSEIEIPVPVSKGGTGLTSLTSGAALIGAGTGNVTTRSITNNTSTSSAISGSTNLVTMNTLRYALNRTSSVASSDTSYSTYMARGIAAGTSDLTAGTSSLASGCIYLVYSITSSDTGIEGPSVFDDYSELPPELAAEIRAAEAEAADKDKSEAE